jgi:hypothetical protein
MRNHKEQKIKLQEKRGKKKRRRGPADAKKNRTITRRVFIEQTNTIRSRRKGRTMAFCVCVCVCVLPLAPTLFDMTAERHRQAPTKAAAA